MPKWMKSLLGLFAVLALVYGLLHIPRGPEKPLLPAAPESVTKFSFRTPRTTLVFENKNQHWFLSEPVNALADDWMVTSFLSGLKELRGAEVLSHRAESHAQYDLTDETGLRVSVWGKDQGTPVEWIFGKATADGGSFYVRLPQQNDVVRAEGLIRPSVEGGANAWRERRVLALASGENVERVQVKKGTTVFELAKGTGTWTMDGRAADPEKVSAAVEGIKSLSAVDFIDPPESSNLEKFKLASPRTVLTVGTSAGRTIVVKMGGAYPPESQNIAIAVDDNVSLMTVSAAPLNTVAGASKDFLPAK